MAIIGFIVIGDRTSHGGIVLSGDLTFTIDGQAVARVGDKVFCPRCNVMTTIATSRFPSIFDLGQTMAYDQDSTSCGALLYSRHNNHAGWDDGGEESEAASSSTFASQAVTAGEVQNAPLRFQEHFIFHNEAGELMGKVPYVITTGEGRVYEGETDSAGRTDVVWTESPDAVEVKIGAKAADSADPYHFDEQAHGDL